MSDATGEPAREAADAMAAAGRCPHGSVRCSSCVCSPCQTGDHYDCTNRRRPQGAAVLALAEAIYGPTVSECCCPGGRDRQAVFAELSPPYATIVADPPWPLRKRPNESIYGSRKYATMSLDDIRALPVAALAAADAHLWLWVTNTYMPDCGPIVRAWGFEVTTIVTWCKPGPGIGSYVRNNTEHLVLATRGRAMTPEDKPLSSWYQWPRGSHSVKPAAAFDLIEQVSPDPYVELFARAPRLGWDSWGHGYELPPAASVQGRSLP